MTDRVASVEDSPMPPGARSADPDEADDARREEADHEQEPDPALDPHGVLPCLPRRFLVEWIGQHGGGGEAVGRRRGLVAADAAGDPGATRRGVVGPGSGTPAARAEALVAEVLGIGRWSSHDH